jgi:cellulose synthase/poly-beta-1,6-N-acetylglucosamine synthase-like glycosyltransferase
VFEVIFLILVSGYFLISSVLVIGAKKKFSKISGDKLPSVSVIVAARNEENNILSCLESLNNLVYPEDKIEIIIVDDASTDKTNQFISGFITDKPKFTLLKLIEENDGKLRGKTRAMVEGIKASSGEIILTTDADCVVNPLWAKTIASYYQEDVGLVNGYTTQSMNGSFSGMQAIDFIYLLFIAAGTINLGKPVSCIGNNMSFRKKAYEETGGFENLPFSVTEDFLLLNSIHKLRKYKLAYPLDANALVTSKPCASLGELLKQKKRWAVGGIEAPPFGVLLMSWAFLTNLFILATPFLFSAIWIYLVFFKLAIDFFVLLPLHRKLGLQKNLKYFFVFEIYLMVYLIILPFAVLFNNKVKWKDRVY